MLEKTSEVIYASPNKRFLAAWVDSLTNIIFILFIIILIFASVLGITPNNFSSTHPALYFLFFFLSFLTFQFLIYLFLWNRTLGTPGKWILGCEIVDSKTFQKPTLKQLIIRYCSYYISGFILYLGYLNILWDKKNRCWHDILAGTVVIYNPANTNWLGRIKIALSRIINNDLNK
jgi:uncharacterized RDD family membrane protein YckC